jgi:NitT/TauT family transport system permease protein
MKRSTAIDRTALPAGVLFLIFLWSLLSALVARDILLPSPMATAKTFWALLFDPEFYRAVTGSTFRVLLSFSVSFVAGAAYGLLAAKLEFFNLFFKPCLVVIKTLPIMTVIVLAFLWVNNSLIPVFVGILITFPIFAEAFFSASHALDPSLLRVAKVYKVSRKKCLSQMLWPSMRPGILTAAASSASMTWKIIITAEYLSLPNSSIGSLLYSAKTILDSRQIFALVLSALFLGGLTETLVFFIQKKVRAQKW